MKNFPKLETDRLLLNDIRNTDPNDLLKGLSDEQVIKYYGVSFYSIEAVYEQVKWYRELIDKKTGIWWSINLKESDSFIGACGFNDFNPVENKIEIGFWLLPKFWRKGLMTEAVREINKFAFDELNISSIIAEVESENHRTIKFLEKLNFVFVERKSVEEKKGEKLILNYYELGKA